MTDEELREAVDEIIDAEDVRLLTGRAEVVLADVDVLVDRAEAIAELRTAQGKHLSRVIQERLAELAGQLKVLRDVMSGGVR